MYRSGQPIHCLKISGNKNNLRTIWGWNRQKVKNSPAWAESYTGSYKKKKERVQKKYANENLAASEVWLSETIDIFNHFLGT